MVGQFSGDLGNQTRLARPGFTTDEYSLTVTALDAYPGLLERGQFGAPAHERAAPTCDEFGRKRWSHPLRHVLNVMAPLSVRR